jgi:hypothetical protein
MCGCFNLPAYQTLVLSAVLLVIFVAWQRFKKTAALVPLILLQSRTM